MAHTPTSPAEVVVGTLQRDTGQKHSLGEKVEGRGKASCKKLYLPLSFGSFFFFLFSTSSYFRSWDLFLRRLPNPSELALSPFHYTLGVRVGEELLDLSVLALVLALCFAICFWPSQTSL